jgi:hypothetical protein
MHQVEKSTNLFNKNDLELFSIMNKHNPNIQKLPFYSIKSKAKQKVRK